MGRSQETFNKKEIRNRKEKKRKEKEQKKAARKDQEKRSGLDEMIAYVDENGVITSTPPDPEKREEVVASELEISTPKNSGNDNPNPEHSGIVSFYNSSKGFGFIRDNETGQTVFVHASNLLEPIDENDRVSFETGKGPKGPTALNVRKAGS
ncbi:MAG TPA: cold shock domain-containing protein [Prolixibacteraceae bacterium]|nr:cold shock domain-containing protein [Prolixibacteraceae bacterium]